MPPRRRRRGYREGHLSDQLRDALEAEAADAAEVEGAVAQINAASDIIAAVDGGLDAVRSVRLRAVMDLRQQGWSYDRIAAATVLSKSRVRQLGTEAADRGIG